MDICEVERYCTVQWRREKKGFSVVFTHTLKHKANKTKTYQLRYWIVYSRLERQDKFFSVMTDPLETFYKRRPATRKTSQIATWMNEEVFFSKDMRLISLGLLWASQDKLSHLKRPGNRSFNKLHAIILSLCCLGYITNVVMSRSTVLEKNEC